jgi:hypothetical protein
MKSEEGDEQNIFLFWSRMDFKLKKRRSCFPSAMPLVPSSSFRDIGGHVFRSSDARDDQNEGLGLQFHRLLDFESIRYRSCSLSVR